MKKFRHVYIEITNVCQFHCSFCPKTSRLPHYMNTSEFYKIAKQVSEYTDTIYLHVLGEPLLHPDLHSLLVIAQKHALTVNITTNGFALAKHREMLCTHHHIKKINISLHSMEDCNQQMHSLTAYLQAATAFAEQAVTDIPCTILYRLWNANTAHQEILHFLQEYYQIPLHKEISPQNGIRLRQRIFLHQQNLFTWPVQSIAAPHNGYCLGLKSHIAVLVNGDVVPCCLDSEGQLVLGNLHEASLKELLEGTRAVSMSEGFQQRKATEALCKQCSYKDRFAITV